MNKPVLMIFLAEVQFQCNFVLISADLYDSATALPTSNFDQINNRRNMRWFALQGVVVAAANISKLFWGGGGNKAESRTELRELLAVKDDESPLYDPLLRNDFEHFDERVETYFAQSESQGFLGRGMGKPPIGMDIEKRFQWFEPQTGTLTFWAHSVLVPSIVTEATRIIGLIPDAIQTVNFNKN